MHPNLMSIILTSLSDWLNDIKRYTISPKR